MKSDTLNVFLTAVIALTGVVGILLVIQGGKDTVRIRDAAEKQAGAAKSFAETAKNINEGIGEAVIKLGQQADEQVKAANAARDAAKAATSAARTAATQLESTQRPWIILDASISGPLRFDYGGDADFKFLFTVKNMGPGVATQIKVEDEIYIIPGQYDLRHEAERFCETVAHAPSDNMHILFPQQSPEEDDLEGSLSRRDINAFQDFAQVRSHLHDSTFPAYVIGCVAYSAPYNPAKRYYTSITYQIVSVVNSVFTNGNGLAAEEMTLKDVHGEGTLAR